MSIATETFVPPVVTGQEDWNAPGLSEKERYGRYLCSRHWGVRREAVHRRANGICEHCKTAAISHVHHTTYARKYNEPLEDLMGVCEPCHNFIHGRSDVDPAAAIADEEEQADSLTAINDHRPAWLRDWNTANESRREARCSPEADPEKTCDATQGGDRRSGDAENEDDEEDSSEEEAISPFHVYEVIGAYLAARLVHDPGFCLDDKWANSLNQDFRRLCGLLDSMEFEYRDYILRGWLAAQHDTISRWARYAIYTCPFNASRTSLADWSALTYRFRGDLESVRRHIVIRDHMLGLIDKP